MIFDTDILIWALRGNEKAAKVIDNEAKCEISIVSHLELLQGARDKRDIAAIRHLLLNFETIPLSAEIGFRARVYLEEHGLKIALGVADALIAATVVETQSRFCTANIKHYRVIKDLDLHPFRPT